MLKIIKFEKIFVCEMKKRYFLWYRIIFLNTIALWTDVQCTYNCNQSKAFIISFFLENADLQLFSRSQRTHKKNLVMLLIFFKFYLLLIYYFWGTLQDISYDYFEQSGSYFFRVTKYIDDMILADKPQIIFLSISYFREYKSHCICENAPTASRRTKCSN